MKVQPRRSSQRIGVFLMTAVAGVTLVSIASAGGNGSAGAVSGATGPNSRTVAIPAKPAVPEKRGRDHGEVVLVLADDSAEAGLLREAYAALAKADHDYKGHRIKAMHDVAHAAKQLGVRLRGDGRGHEAQGESDDKLRYASGLLSQVAGSVGGAGLKHIQAAINQINMALNVH